MRVSIAAIPIELGRFEIKCRRPARVRFVAFQQRKTMVMTAGRAEFEEQPVLFVEGSPDEPIVTRTYVAFEHGQAFDTQDGEDAEWAGTGISARGATVHVFEIRTVIDTRDAGAHAESLTAQLFKRGTKLT